MNVYYLPLNSEEWNSTEDTLLKHVSKERQNRISRYLHNSDRKLSLYAALLTRMAIMENTNLSAEELVFSCKANQKPFLLTDSTIDFSFSHTKNAILLCLSTKHRVGVDIETYKDAPFEIMPQVFHPSEIQYICDSDVTLQSKHFFEIWTRKEAYTKRNGTGLVCDLPVLNTLSVPISDYLHTWQEDNYICSVCCFESSVFQLQRISEECIWNYFL